MENKIICEWGGLSQYCGSPLIDVALKFSFTVMLYRVCMTSGDIGLEGQTTSGQVGLEGATEIR